MAYFRHPKTRNERRADHALASDPDAPRSVKARLRGTRKDEAVLPSEFSDLDVAARKDRSRGKASHAPARKAAAKARDGGIGR